jgi:hypothetical protein
MEINPRFFPVPLHRALRQPAHGGDLGEGEPAEELEIHDLGQNRVDGSELVERIADAGEREAR